MSWLFDRLCDLAVADQVVVSVTIDDSNWHGVEPIDLADVLVRAARARQFDMLLTVGSSRPTGSAAPSPAPTGPVEIDAGDLASVAARLAPTLGDPRAVARGAAARSAAAEHDSLVVHAGAGVVAFGEQSWSRLPWRIQPGWDVRWLVASDDVEPGPSFESFEARDLAVVVGADAPRRAHRVDDLSALVAVVDALITLRHYAFGIDTFGASTAPSATATSATG